MKDREIESMRLTIGCVKKYYAKEKISGDVINDILSKGELVVVFVF